MDFSNYSSQKFSSITEFTHGLPEEGIEQSLSVTSMLDAGSTSGVFLVDANGNQDTPIEETPSPNVSQFLQQSFAQEVDIHDESALNQSIRMDLQQLARVSLSSKLPRLKAPLLDRTLPKLSTDKTFTPHTLLKTLSRCSPPQPNSSPIPLKTSSMPPLAETPLSESPTPLALYDEFLMLIKSVKQTLKQFDLSAQQEVVAKANAELVQMTHRLDIQARRRHQLVVDVERLKSKLEMGDESSIRQQERLKWKLEEIERVQKEVDDLVQTESGKCSKQMLSPGWTRALQVTALVIFLMMFEMAITVFLVSRFQTYIQSMEHILNYNQPEYWYKPFLNWMFSPSGPIYQTADTLPGVDWVPT